ncbi:hypothetical protein SAY86_017929 [Trapa natans]|uniref:Uncharacterized protein n=1 Tax=Trapa natans TaxID=22666 RepID=A0AAN7R731_TRANT|nr:hypothetical protein SAY86_017929 [Trapa natans]
MPANTITAALIPSFAPPLNPPEELPESAFGSEMTLPPLGMDGASEGTDNAGVERGGREGDAAGEGPEAALEGGGAGGDEVGLRGVLAGYGVGDAFGEEGNCGGGASAAGPGDGAGKM